MSAGERNRRGSSRGASTRSSTSTQHTPSRMHRAKAVSTSVLDHPCPGPSMMPHEQRDRGGDQQHGAGRIQPPERPRARCDQEADRHRAQQCEGYDTPEQGLPGAGRQERSTRGVADDAAQSGDRPPGGQGAPPPLGGCRVDEHAHAVGHHQRSTQATHDAPHQHHGDTRRQGGHGGTGGEHHQARQQDPFAAEPVAHRTGGDDEAREDDDVGIHDPQQARGVRVQVTASQERDREVDGRDETHDEDRAQAHRHQHRRLAVPRVAGALRLRHAPTPSRWSPLPGRPERQ